MKSLSRVRPSVTLWTAAFQAPPSMGFSRQEYWSGVPLPSPALDTKPPQPHPCLRLGRWGNKTPISGYPRLQPFPKYRLLNSKPTWGYHLFLISVLIINVGPCLTKHTPDELYLENPSRAFQSSLARSRPRRCACSVNPGSATGWGRSAENASPDLLPVPVPRRHSSGQRQGA